MEDKVHFLPIFEVKSKALKEMLGVNDQRTVVNRLREIGVPIYLKGKNSYIVTLELIHALKAPIYTTYQVKGKFSVK